MQAKLVMQVDDLEQERLVTALGNIENFSGGNITGGAGCGGAGSILVSCDPAEEVESSACNLIVKREQVDHYIYKKEGL